MSATPGESRHTPPPHGEPSSSAPQAARQVEPWLRGTLGDIDALRRQVLHALELTGEDLQRWCATLDDAGLNARPHRLPSVAFQIRHISRSLDRLLTYAEGRQLSPDQLTDLATESEPGATRTTLFSELDAALTGADRRVRLFDPRSYEEIRGVGRARLPTTVAGLLVHCAEHTQRHTGQAITTAKVVAAMRPR